MVSLGQGAVTKLCLHLCRRILALPLERFEESNPDGLLAVLTEDIVIVANALVGIPQVCVNVPIVVACLVYAGWLSPTVFVCGTVFAALAITAYLAFSAKGVDHLRSARAGQDVLVGQFRTLIEGFRELKQNRRRREAFLDHGLEPSAGTVRDRTIAGLTLFAWAEGFSQLAFFGFIGFLLFVLPGMVTISRAALAGTVLVVLYIMSPLDVIITWLPVLGRARASMLKIEALIPTLETNESDEGAASTSLARFHESLQLEGVTYAYPSEPDGGRFALGPMDLTVHQGEIIFVVGGNGSGKTTLVKLLSGLYGPGDGAVLVDGRVLEPDDREAYRQNFSVVFADGFLFEHLFGIDEPERDDLASAWLERLGLDRQVSVTNGRFSTVELSQGQRRRLALLTALLEDRPICIFDEWAANQDPHFKKVFYLELLPDLKARGKTLLIISHDEEYYDAADRIIRLRDGLISEETQALTEDVPLCR
jgi:putative ATP-binding cassette transporter